jgi:pimeloyl-ACP methyl ester carboxylesterase
MCTQSVDVEAHDRYHLIVPSLPGWAYSSPPPLDREFAVKDIAKVINGLMVGLGFNKYIAQGGDIGSMVAVDLGVNHDACSGKLGLNLSARACPPPPRGSYFVPNHAAQTGQDAGGCTSECR